MPLQKNLSHVFGFSQKKRENVFSNCEWSLIAGEGDVAGRRWWRGESPGWGHCPRFSASLSLDVDRLYVGRQRSRTAGCHEACRTPVPSHVPWRRTGPASWQPACSCQLDGEAERPRRDHRCTVDPPGITVRSAGTLPHRLHGASRRQKGISASTIDTEISTILPGGMEVRNSGSNGQKSARNEFLGRLITVGYTETHSLTKFSFPPSPRLLLPLFFSVPLYLLPPSLPPSFPLISLLPLSFFLFPFLFLLILLLVLFSFFFFRKFNLFRFWETIYEKIWTFFFGGGGQMLCVHPYKVILEITPCPPCSTRLWTDIVCVTIY